MPKPISSMPSSRALVLGMGFILESVLSSVGIVYIAHKLLSWLGMARLEGRALGRLYFSAMGDPYFLLAIGFAIVSSYLVNRRWPRSLARWVWVLPGIWLLYNIGENLYWNHYHWPGTPPDPWHYVWDNFFGTACGATECVSELIATAPFYASVAYGMVAWVLSYKRQATSFQSAGENH